VVVLLGRRHGYDAVSRVFVSLVRIVCGRRRTNGAHCRHDNEASSFQIRRLQRSADEFERVSERRAQRAVRCGSLESGSNKHRHQHGYPADFNTKKRFS
jgi:hypothetical protein